MSAGLHGEVSEWSIVQSWKDCLRQRSVGSNPTLSEFSQSETAAQLPNHYHKFQHWLDVNMDHFTTKLKEIETTYNELQEKLADPSVVSDPNNYKRLAKARHQLQQTVDAYHDLLAVQ